MNHSFPFVCGDRFLYFPEENTIFLQEGEVKEKGNQIVLILSALSRTTVEGSSLMNSSMWLSFPRGLVPTDAGEMKFPRPLETKASH